MPVYAMKVGEMWRIMENGRLAMTSRGKPVDGGGHMTKEAAEAQMRAMNARGKR